MPPAIPTIHALSMHDKKRVLVADRLAILRVGLLTLLSEEPTIDVVGEVGGVSSLLKSIEELEPDLILMDAFIQGSSCIQLVNEIKQINPEARIVLLAGCLPSSEVIDGLKVGINGYIVKTAAKSELLLAIHSILKGQTYLSPEFAGHLINNQMRIVNQPSEHNENYPLTRREKDILRLVASGNTSKEIATQLYISFRTVEKHRANLMRKLKVAHIAALVSYAINHGFTEPDINP